MKSGIKPIGGGIVVFLLGVLVIPILIVLPMLFDKSREVQFIAPGKIEVSIEKPGRYYLWNDYKTIYKGTIYNRSKDLPDGMKIVIRNSKGASLNFISDTSVSSSSGSSSKNTLGYVEVERPGQLKIEIFGGKETRIFSFAQSRLLKLIGLVIAGAFFSVLVAISGIGLTVWGFAKLAKGKR